MEGDAGLDDAEEERDQDRHDEGELDGGLTVLGAEMWAASVLHVTAAAFRVKTAAGRRIRPAAACVER
jgi:hypothetical protein